jgi:hypothetical protein
MHKLHFHKLGPFDSALAPAKNTCQGLGGTPTDQDSWYADCAESSGPHVLRLLLKTNPLKFVHV